MNKEELTKKALSFIVKYIKEDYDIPGEEDYNRLIFDVAREGVAIVNAVISALESANIGSAVFKKQFDERYCIEGPAIYNKEKTSLIRICPENNVKDFVVDCNIASNAFMDCQVGKVVVKDSVKSMGSCVFKNCRNLREVIFENGGTKIDNSCFEGCSGELIIKAPSGGYVEEYSKKYNIRFEAL